MRRGNPPDHIRLNKKKEKEKEKEKTKSIFLKRLIDTSSSLSNGYLMSLEEEERKRTRFGHVAWRRTDTYASHLDRQLADGEDGISPIVSFFLLLHR